MRVRVLLFAALREKAGREFEDLELGSGSTLGDAVGLLQARHPSLGSLGSSVRLARNLEMVDVTTLLSDGDEVALIPPVSGG